MSKTQYSFMTSAPASSSRLVGKFREGLADGVGNMGLRSDALEALRVQARRSRRKEAVQAPRALVRQGIARGACPRVVRVLTTGRDVEALLKVYLLLCLRATASPCTVKFSARVAAKALGLREEDSRRHWVVSAYERLARSGPDREESAIRKSR